MVAGFVPAGVGRHHRAYRLTGPDGWSVTARQTHVDDWEIVALFGAAAAALYGSDSEPAGSLARERTRWFPGIEWTGDLAGAPAVARGAGNLGFAGPRVLEVR